MSRAEELALKLYTTSSCGQFGTGDYEPPEVDRESVEAFIKGYHQAEKDLELTWEDIKLIIDIVDSENLKPHLFDEIDYQEVLKRFKNMKDGSKR